MEVVSCGNFTSVPEHYCHRSRAPEHLLIWVVGGRGWLQTEDFDAAVGAGTLLSMRRGPAHTYASDPENPWSILWVHFDGRDAASWLMRIRRFGSPAAPMGVDGRLQARWLEMLGAFYGPRPRDRVLADHLLVALLGLVEHRLASTPGRGAGHETVAAVQAYVQAHLAEPISVADLAKIARLSPAQLTRVMQTHIGCPPIGYVLDQRMAHAATLLRETTRPIKAIAADVGYDDPYHFSRLFRRRIGLSPTHYRDQAADQRSGLEQDRVAADAE